MPAEGVVLRRRKSLKARNQTTDGDSDIPG